MHKCTMHTASRNLEGASTLVSPTSYWGDLSPAEGVEMQLSQYQYQSTPVQSTGNVCSAL